MLCAQLSRFNGTVLRLSPAYIEAYGEPIYFPDISELQPGDVLLARDDAIPETCEAVADLRTKGVRVLFWNLGKARANSPHPSTHTLAGCASFLAHSDMTRDAVLSEHAVIHPYIKDRFLLSKQCPAVASRSFSDVHGDRARVVIFDGDSVTESDIAAFGAHSSEFTYAPVQAILATGIHPQDLYALLANASVVVDLRMPGQERLCMEAIMCGNVFVTDDMFEGSVQADIPLPPALVFPSGILQIGLEVIMSALDCAPDWQPMMLPLFNKAVGFKQSMPGEVQRLFRNDFHFVIPVCDDPVLHAGLLAVDALVTSVLACLPFATIELRVPSVEPFMRAHRALFALLEEHSLRWNVFVFAFDGFACEGLAATEVSSTGAGLSKGLSTPSVGYLLRMPKHPIGTGRLHVLMSLGDVFIAPDLARGDALLAPQTAVLGDKEPIQSSLSETRLFTVVHPGCGGGTLNDVQQCSVLLDDADDTHGFRVPLQLWHAMHETERVKRRSGVAFLCRQPVWIALSAQRTHLSHMCDTF